ncbi:NAD(P)-binding protein [Mycena kentingensis (nom. inval.)]|nr:NAD(P)-binding protein [Mycena kentingensis (nom. inval.)]
MGNAIPFNLRHMTPAHTLAMLRQSYFCGRPRWRTTRGGDVPDLTGKVVIVTGGNAGIGKETVKVLLENNATVYMASRNPSKAAQAIDELERETGRRAIFLKLDLADLATVKRAAEEFQSKETELHVLFNNGGIMTPPIEQVTPYGYDATFGTNVVGHFYLTTLLLPTLLSTARAHTHVRIVTLTSMVHYVASVDYATFIESPKRRKRTPFDQYAQSKWADAVMAVELARRYGQDGIVSLSVNPGNLSTDITQNTAGIMNFLAKLLLIWPPSWGAVGQLWAGTAPEAVAVNGKYIAPWARVAQHRKDVDDPDCGRELWEWLEEQVRKFEAGAG